METVQYDEDDAVSIADALGEAARVARWKIETLAAKAVTLADRAKELEEEVEERDARIVELEAQVARLESEALP